jgi:hypothetical protein
MKVDALFGTPDGIAIVEGENIVAMPAFVHCFANVARVGFSSELIAGQMKMRVYHLTARAPRAMFSNDKRRVLELPAALILLEVFNDA